MNSKFPIRPIDDAASVYSGFAFKSKDFTSSGIPIVKIKNLQGRRVTLDDCQYFPQNKINTRHEKFLLQDCDVLIAMTGQGSVGRVGRIRLHNNEIVLLNQRVGKFVVDESKLSLDYLFYVISMPYYEQVLFDAGAGSGQPNLSPKTILSVKIPHPPLRHQSAIAHILGTLDDKIELNRKMNEMLEAMAQAIFKSWFVDFDPVLDKALAAGNPIPDEFALRAARRQAIKGKYPALPDEIAALFPDSFQDSPQGSSLGPIPEGWEVGVLNDIVEQRNERIQPSSSTVAMPYVPIDCISAKSLFLSESKSGQEAKSSLIKFYKGDILFGAMRPYFHKVCIAPFDGTTRTTAFVFKPINKKDFSFSLMMLFDNSTIDYATQYSTGSTIPYAKWNNSLDKMPIIIPPTKLRHAYESQHREKLDIIPTKYFENQTITSIRDSLLPKLISGEIRIKDAVKYLGEVV